MNKTYSDKFLVIKLDCFYPMYILSINQPHVKSKIFFYNDSKNTLDKEFLDYKPSSVEEENLLFKILNEMVDYEDIKNPDELPIYIKDRFLFS